MRKLVLLAFPLLLIAAGCNGTGTGISGMPGNTASGTTTASSGYSLANKEVLQQNAGNVDWSQVSNMLAYDRISSNGYYRVWKMNPDGSGNVCLTCTSAAMAALPNLNEGNPVWSRDGQFIVFQAQDGPSMGKSKDTLDRPNAGWGNDLWAMDPNGQHFWRLTTQNPATGGAINAQFSNAGNILTWGQRLSPMPSVYGTWELAVANFTVSASGVPSLSNTEMYRPGEQKLYYEPHGFSPDDSTIYLMGNLQRGQNQFGMDLYAFNIASQTLTDLTNTPSQWEEYPTPTPDGKKILYMSTAGTAWTPTHFECDLWIMNTDGSDQERLTYYNDSGSSDYVSGGVSLTDPEFNKAGTQLVVYNNLLATDGSPTARQNATTTGEMWLFNYSSPKGK